MSMAPVTNTFSRGKFEWMNISSMRSDPSVAIPTGSFVEIHIDSFQLQIRITHISSIWIHSMFISYKLPKLFQWVFCNDENVEVGDGNKNKNNVVLRRMENKWSKNQIFGATAYNFAISNFLKWSVAEQSITQIKWWGKKHDSYGVYLLIHLCKTIYW